MLNEEIIGEISEKEYTGKIKFFNENHEFGYIICDQDGSDVFFHYDDAKKLKLTKKFLWHANDHHLLVFAFKTLDYLGKKGKCRKAVDLRILLMKEIN